MLPNRRAKIELIAGLFFVIDELMNFVDAIHSTHR
jgi:hypothetical protein